MPPLTFCMCHATKINNDPEHVYVFLEIQESHYVVDFRVRTTNSGEKVIYSKIVLNLPAGSEDSVEFSDSTKKTKTYKNKCLLPVVAANLKLKVYVEQDFDHLTLSTFSAVPSSAAHHTTAHEIVDPRRV